MLTNFDLRRQQFRTLRLLLLLLLLMLVLHQQSPNDDYVRHVHLNPRSCAKILPNTDDIWLGNVGIVASHRRTFVMEMFISVTIATIEIQNEN